MPRDDMLAAQYPPVGSSRDAVALAQDKQFISARLLELHEAPALEASLWTAQMVG
jgi:hypothetical protein